MTPSMSQIYKSQLVSNPIYYQVESHNPALNNKIMHFNAKNSLTLKFAYDAIYESNS